MKRNKQGVVYLIGNSANRLVKIGKTVDMDKRLHDLQCGSPVALEVLWRHRGEFELETYLLRAFASKRHHGDWFDLGPDPVQTVEASSLDPQSLMGVRRIPLSITG